MKALVGTTRSLTIPANGKASIAITPGDYVFRTDGSMVFASDAPSDASLVQGGTNLFPVDGLLPVPWKITGTQISARNRTGLPVILFWAEAKTCSCKGS